MQKIHNVKPAIFISKGSLIFSNTVKQGSYLISFNNKNFVNGYKQTNSSLSFLSSSFGPGFFFLARFLLTFFSSSSSSWPDLISPPGPSPNSSRSLKRVSHFVEPEGKISRSSKRAKFSGPGSHPFSRFCCGSAFPSSFKAKDSIFTGLRCSSPPLTRLELFQIAQRVKIRTEKVRNIKKGKGLSNRRLRWRWIVRRESDKKNNWCGRHGKKGERLFLLNFPPEEIN
ncbi:serine/threonine-protein phosphatase 2A activator2 [Striga asiatica]|uniref:Serine/threonine-protein phosphatase 2A activator2 n=1 Tax=Striga asiatica TaxID=4170 RepID=A0A5A7P7W8_STRAF|nr:serine/threonine-protein phosphatase 2A activator2 [Striga asiatica]